MTPDSRWVFAAALALATLVWVALSHERVGPHYGWAPLHADDIDESPRTDIGAAADLQSRWLGHGVVVKHLPTERRSRVVAPLDGEGSWTSAAPEYNASSGTDSTKRALP